MARHKTAPDLVRAKWQLAERLRTVRTEVFGDHGLFELARRLGVPPRTWYSYESGVTVPAEILLLFLKLTRVEPRWLLNGEDPKYRTGLEAPPTDPEDVLASAEQDARCAHRSAADDTHFLSTAPATASAVLSRTTTKEASNSHPDCETRNGLCRFVRVHDDAMLPIIADGAFVAYCEVEEAAEELDGHLVVAWVEDGPIVRWFHLSASYAVLRAENRMFGPATRLVDLESCSHGLPVRRVLCVGTSH